MSGKGLFWGNRLPDPGPHPLASIQAEHHSRILSRMQGVTTGPGIAALQPEPMIRLKDAVPCMELAGMIAAMPPHLRHEACAAFFMRFGKDGKSIDIAEFWAACAIPPDPGEVAEEEGGGDR